VDEINKRPNHTRSLFYLARTYTYLKNYTGAYWAYTRLSIASTWRDERYEAMYCRALVARDMNVEWNELHSLLLEAHNTDPSKVDALYDIMIHYMIDESTYPIAWLYAISGVTIPLPDNAKVIQNVLLRDSSSLYTHQHAKVTAQLAHHESIHDWLLCVQACNHVLLTK
jgi:hypothetical protein